jgi:hypothetical protein
LSKWLLGSAGFRLGSRATFVPAKVAKTNDATPGRIKMGWTQDNGGRANSLRSNKARRMI